MDLRDTRYTERPLVKTKIIATIGPACETRQRLEELAIAGVDLFRLNFAHGRHDWLSRIVQFVREISGELHRPIGLLGDLAGPKIRLGELPEEGVLCQEGDEFEFVRDGADGSPAARSSRAAQNPTQLTCTYPQLIDDLKPGDLILLADGTVGMRVQKTDAAAGRALCLVERPGRIRSRQGVNLPGVDLSTPSITPKDEDDLKWAVEHQLDYLGLSFVRSAEDIVHARQLIEAQNPQHPPRLVAKIEKLEAVSDLERILEEADAVMVARGDLGVEVDVAQVPILQKRIIRLCNQQRLPVITATQMLDSMQRNEMPTRAEASDVANAVLDGSDAVMLSGETAVGDFPVQAVAMMSRIIHESERLIEPHDPKQTAGHPRTRALIVTEGVTLGAGVAAEHLDADLIVVCTHSGRTAMAVSKQRGRVPILALSDSAATARRMCLFWGVTALETSTVNQPPQRLLDFVVDWGRQHKVVSSGSRIVLVASTNWSAEGHDTMLVHVIP